MSEIEKPNRLVDGLMERAQKAEAELESAQKMCDHWYLKAAERQGQVCEWKRRAENAGFEVKRQKDIANPVDWPRVRIEAAIAAMQGMWASQCDSFGKPMPVFAVECADGLIAELQKKEVQG